MDIENLIASIRSEIQTAEQDLAVATEAASRVPVIEAELDRARAALKALGAPQSPDGRKRIGDGQRKRRKKEANPEAGTAPAVVQPASDDGRLCDHCHRREPGDQLFACGEDGCECQCHAPVCLKAHRMRFHTEDAA